MAAPIITLTTDFGLSDAYVGAMKGAILAISPQAILVDISHDVCPGDILGGSLILEAAVPHFPREAIHLAVVDPGVGGSRGAVAIRSANGYYVGPDNGLFHLSLLADPPLLAVRLTNPAYHGPRVSPTFHGRDIFGPAAAHLAAGVSISELGESAPPLIALNLPEPVRRASRLEIQVLHVDRFGNLITNLTAEAFTRMAGAEHESAKFEIADSDAIPFALTYSDVQEGCPVAYVGSGGRLEIGVRNGSAADRFNAGRDTVIQSTINAG